MKTKELKSSAWRLALSLGTFTALVAMTPPAIAQDLKDAAEPPQNFNIPAQSLESALAAFAKQTQLQLVAPSNLVGGLKTGGVLGQRTPGAALEALLAPAGLTYSMTDNRTVAVVRVVTAQPEPQVPVSKEASAWSGLEEVVVTARRREERLQTVPIGITAFTAAALEEKGIQSYSDLQHFVPSVEVRQQSRDAQNFFIRGQGVNGTAGAWPGVVSYFADVPWIETGAGNYVDLESVQALRGPQGTLFGRNTTGGAVLFEPKKPANGFEGYAQATFGNYSDEAFEGAVNIPIVPDKLLMRVAGSHEVRDGFTRDVATGQDLDNRDYWSSRVYVTFRPTDNFQNDVIYSVLYSHTNGGSVILTGFNPNNIPGQPKGSFVTTFGLAKAQAFLADQQALGPRSVNTLGVSPLDKTYHWGVIDKAVLDLDDDLTLRNIASIQDMRNLFRYDSVPIPANFFGLITPSGWETSWEQYADELQLQGRTADGTLKWTVGSYLEFLHPAGQSQGVLRATPATVLVGSGYPNNADGPANQTSRSQAVYAQGTYDFSQWVEGLKFTAGYRYTWDFRGITAEGYTTSFGPKICTQIGSTTATNCKLSAGARFSDPSWNLTLDYQLASNTLVYVTGSHGYKSGGFNNNAPSLALLKYSSERLTNAEIGIKSDWTLFGAPIRTNADAFYDTIANAQRSIGTQVTLPTGASSTETIVSTADVTIQGIELEGQVVPFKGFEVSGTYSYDYAHYDGAVLLPTLVGTQRAYIPYPAVPRHQISLTGRYHLPIDETYGDISFAAVGSYRTSDEFATDGAPQGIQNGYFLLDLRADWNNVMGYPADIELFANNVTNKLYTVGIYDLYYSTGTVSKVYGEPTMYGVKLRYRFGGSAGG